jgi:hypothetical protein
MTKDTKRVYHFSNPTKVYNEHMYARLSPENIKFLDWLAENDFFSNEMSYELLDEMPEIAEF